MIEDNYKRFCDLLRSTNREGIEDLISWLDSSDFKVAPASCNYHQNYEGGLCEHVLSVYDNLVKLSKDFAPTIDETSIIIVALLHDISKVNFYEQYDKNVKIDGQWVQEKHYKVRDIKDRFIYATHEQNSLFIVQQFISLSIEEQLSILCHHGGMDPNGTPVNAVNDVYNKYTLPIYLHIADLIDACAHHE